MKVAFDLDNVILQYDMTSAIEKVTGVGILEEHLWCFDFSECLGITQDKALEIIYTMYGSAKVSEGCLEVLRWLRSRGHEVIIYTSRCKFQTRKDVALILDELCIPYDTLISAELPLPKVDYFVDDYVPKLVNSSHKARKSLLYSQPWNLQCLNVNSLFKRVNGWKEILRELKHGEKRTKKVTRQYQSVSDVLNEGKERRLRKRGSPK